MATAVACRATFRGFESHPPLVTKVFGMETYIYLDTHSIRWHFQFLRSIQRRAPLYEPKRLRERTRAGVLPALRGFGTTVEVRGVFKRELRLGEKSDDFSNCARPFDLEPITSVAISLDSGTPDEFYFQSDPKTLAAFVEKLKFALVQSQFMSNAVQLEQNAGR